MTGENVQLLDRARQGDREAAERLVVENAGLIWSIARRYFGRGVDAEDLYQLGCVGFLKAIAGFDTEFGTQFSTYAVPKIAGEIRRFLRDDGAAARIIYQLQQKAIAAMPAILHELPARQIPMRSYSISNTSSVRSSLREDYFTPAPEIMDVSQPQQLQDIVHSIHTNNRKLVIILGSSGSGKSTLAKNLSQRLMHQNKHVRLYSSTNMPLKHLLSDGLVAFRELLEQPNTVVILDYSAKEYALGSMRRSGKTISTAQHLLPQLQLMLSDLTEIIMVTTPEKEPATQAMRIQNFLQHLGVCIDYWIVNQSLYPMHPESSLLKAKASFEVPWINEICRRSNGRFVLVPWEDDAG